MTLPKATVRVDVAAGVPAQGGDILTLIAPVFTSADGRPRLFASHDAVITQHGYSEAAEYVAWHIAQTGKPVLLCGVPVANPGAIGAEVTSGNTGTCVTTLTASGGPRTKHQGVLSVIDGGTIGTDQIVIGLSLDGGRTRKRIRLGTANSYVIPYVGVTIAFSAGTLVAGDVIHTWRATSPELDASGVQLAREELQKTQFASRSWMILTDVADDTLPLAVASEVLAYNSEAQRATRARLSAREQDTLVRMSATTVRSTATTVTFDNTDENITRVSGSFIADGFTPGMLLTVSGTASGTNDFVTTAPIVSVSHLEIVLATADAPTDQVGTPAVIVGSPSITASASADTFTRTSGDWVADGFRPGQTITVTGSSNNNSSFLVTDVSPLVLTVDDGVTDETFSAAAVTVTAGETVNDWLNDLDASLSSVTGSQVGIGVGQFRFMSPISAWMIERNAQWAACVHEYQHDYHIATWRKSDGPTVGGTITDTDGNLEQYDDRVYGGLASNLGFTSLRSWANGPLGVFVSQDYTRAEPGSLLQYTHNGDVVNLAVNTVQRATEAIIGEFVPLNADGTATTEALATISARVNNPLQRVVLTSVGEGVRASGAVWTPSATDKLDQVPALLTGVLDLKINGTVHSVATVAKVS